jgi:hypothetical protein
LLKVFAWVSLGVGFACALFIAADETRRPQKMGVMNVVWPVSALYFSVFALWAYLRWGLKKTREAMREHTHGQGGRTGSEKGDDGSEGKEQLRRSRWEQATAGRDAPSQMCSASS